MTLQWTVVSGFLLVEIAIVTVLILPWLRPLTWSRILRSNFLRGFGSSSRVTTWVYAGLLVFLFTDAIRDIMRYTSGHTDMLNASSEAMHYMHLFRSQRNAYISGLALFLWFVIGRLIGHILEEAHLQASLDATMKQAINASKAAKELLQELDKETADCEQSRKQISQLKEELRVACEHHHHSSNGTVDGSTKKRN